MTNGRQKLSQASRIAIVDLLCELALIAGHTQRLHIIDAVDATARKWLHMIHSQLTYPATTQASVIEPITHCNPITITNLRTGLPIATAMIGRLRMKPNTIRIVFEPLICSCLFMFNVIRTIPQSLCISLSAMFLMIRSLFLAVCIGIVPIFLFALFQHYITSSRIAALLAINLNTAHASRVCSIIRKWLPYLATWAYATAISLHAQSCVLSPVRFFRFIIGFLARNTPGVTPKWAMFIGIKISQWEDLITSRTTLGIEEGLLYNSHVSLPKRLAVPAGVSAPRGLFVRFYYTIFNALGGSTCLLA